MSVTAYPNAAGWKVRDTSEAAAERIEATGRGRTLRERARQLFEAGHRLTADEAAARLDASILAIRPRVSELARQGLIRDTGDRRPNSSGTKAIVWGLAPPPARMLPSGQVEMGL